MHMKTGVEQSVYAILLLNMLPNKAVLSGEAISQQLNASPTYYQKLLRKLVSADLIASVPGVKGGFRLKKRPEDICVYDIYLAIEGRQSLYSPSGILGDLLELEKNEYGCLLTDLMNEAESAWKTVMKRETIASLAQKMEEERFQPKAAELQQWLNEKNACSRKERQSMITSLTRINELAKLAKETGLTQAQEVERQVLREDYLREIRGQVESSVTGLTIIDPLGNDVTPDKVKKQNLETNLMERM